MKGQGGPGVWVTGAPSRDTWPGLGGSPLTSLCYSGTGVGDSERGMEAGSSRWEELV